MMLSSINQTGVSAMSYTSSAATVSTVSEEETTQSEVASSSNQDTYTPSAEAMAYMAAEENSEAVVDPEDTTVGDTVVEQGEVEDTTVEDTTVEDVEVEEEVEAEEEVEEEEEAEEEADSSLNSLTQSYSDYDWDEVKLNSLSNQWNTLTSMLNAVNSSASDNLSSVASESWVSDASTFNYAGRYMAKTAAGTTNVQQQAAAAMAAENAEEKEAIEYNNFSIDGNVSSETTE